MLRLRFASFLAPNLFPVYQFIVERVGRRLGIATELSVGGEVGDLAADRADAGFL